MCSTCRGLSWGSISTSSTTSANDPVHLNMTRMICQPQTWPPIQMILFVTITLASMMFAGQQSPMPSHVDLHWQAARLREERGS